MDCEWSEWSIGECTTTCGGGIQIKTRTSIIEAAYGGKECDGASNMTEDCNIQNCPGIVTFIYHYNSIFECPYID